MVAYMRHLLWVPIIWISRFTSRGFPIKDYTFAWQFPVSNGNRYTCKDVLISKWCDGRGRASFYNFPLVNKVQLGKWEIPIFRCTWDELCCYKALCHACNMRNGIKMRLDHVDNIYITSGVSTQWWLDNFNLCLDHVVFIPQKYFLCTEDDIIFIKLRSYFACQYGLNKHKQHLIDYDIHHDYGFT